MTAAARLTSRTTTLLLVCAAHGLVWWLLWRTSPRPEDEPEGFATQTFLIFEDPSVPQRALAAPARTAAHRPRPAAAAGEAPGPAPASLPVATADSSAITLPAPSIDWTAQLPDAAGSVLEKEKRSAEQLDALGRRYQVPDDPRNPHPGPPGTFRWSEAGIHRIDTRNWIPVLHVGNRCVMVLFIMPACAIGHIETHGDLFEGAAAVHDEKLAAPRPNDAP